MKRLFLLAAITAPLALGAVHSAPAEAKSVKFHGHHDRHHDNWKLSCNTARHMLREQGYEAVKVKSCISTIYSFHAVRKGRYFVVYVNSRTGFIWRG